MGSGVALQVAHLAIKNIAQFGKLFALGRILRMERTRYLARDLIFPSPEPRMHLPASGVILLVDRAGKPGDLRGPANYLGRSWF
jgi:hypothetical protein